MLLPVVDKRCLYLAIDSMPGGRPPTPCRTSRSNLRTPFLGLPRSLFGADMQQGVVTVGLDLAKHVFQVHAIDAEGKVLIRRQLRRSEALNFFAGLAPCLVGMEACASAHHWGREPMRLGHKVRLMPPAYVKPYVKRGKTDAADAEAICEAVTRPTMRLSR